MLVGRRPPQDAQTLWKVSNGQVQLTFFRSYESSGGLPRDVFIETPYLSVRGDVYFSMHNWFNFEYPVKPHFFTEEDHAWIKARLFEFQLMFNPLNQNADLRYDLPKLEEFICTRHRPNPV
jgi:hypothetical protein